MGMVLAGLLEILVGIVGLCVLSFLGGYSFSRKRQRDNRAFNGLVLNDEQFFAERAQFESWAHDFGYVEWTFQGTQPVGSAWGAWYYFEDETQQAWEAWKARASPTIALQLKRGKPSS